jgi:glycosyltransferase involved in cell wall biosynthesis
MSISVIIPFKKNIDFLRETIDCFLNQSLLPSEIIIVNDHSEESLTPLKKAYNDQITFLENPGAGACDARNYGFLASKGNFIKFFDSDDLTTNNTLEVQSKALENSDRKMIYGPVVKVFSSNGKWQQQDTIIYYNKYKSKIPFDKLLLHGWSCGLPQCMFKREIFNEAGLWESGLQSRQDVEFLFRIAQIEPYPLHENLSCLFYRQHEMQITGGAITNEHLSQDLVYVLEKIRESVLSDPLRYNLIDRFNIESQLAIHLKSCSKSFQKDFTKSHNSVSILTSFLGPKIFRFNNKYQRLLTHSNWNIDIGPKKDPEVFLEFQTKIKLPSATFKAIESLKVSIIIPTLNRKHLIEKTLNNILNQTIKPYEIIVVDDHSIDGTFDYL